MTTLVMYHEMEYNCVHEVYRRYTVDLNVKKAVEVQLLQLSSTLVLWESDGVLFLPHPTTPNHMALLGSTTTSSLTDGIKAVIEATQAVASHHSYLCSVPQTSDTAFYVYLTTT